MFHIIVFLLTSAYCSAVLFNHSLFYRPVSLTILAALTPFIMNDSIFFEQVDLVDSVRAFALSTLLILFLKSFKDNNYFFSLFFLPIVLVLTTIVAFYHDFHDKTALWIFTCLLIVLFEFILSFILHNKNNRIT